MNIFILVYSTSAIVAVVLYMIYVQRYGTPYYIGGSDDLAYELSARETAIRLGLFDYTSIRGTIVSLTHNSVGYVYLVSLLYRLGELLGGFHTMIPRLFNSMCLGILSVLTYRMSCRVNLQKRVSIATGLAVGLSPIMTYNAAHTFRDIVVALLLFIGVYVWTPKQNVVQRSSGLWRWFVIILLYLILAEFRYTQAIVLLLVAFIGDWISSIKGSQGNRQIHTLFLMLVLLSGLLLKHKEISDLFSRLQYSQSSYTQYRSNMSDGLSSYVFNAPLPLGYLLRLGYALIIPLPVPSREIERTFLSLGTVIQFFFLPFLGKGIFVAFKDHTKWPIVVSFIILFGGMAFFTFTDRHITQFFPYAAILAAMGYERWRYQKTVIWALMGMLGMLFMIVYCVMKTPIFT